MKLLLLIPLAACTEEESDLIRGLGDSLFVFLYYFKGVCGTSWR